MKRSEEKYKEKSLIRLYWHTSQSTKHEMLACVIRIQGKDSRTCIISTNHYMKKYKGFKSFFLIL